MPSKDSIFNKGFKFVFSNKDTHIKKRATFSKRVYSFNTVLFVTCFFFLIEKMIIIPGFWGVVCSLIADFVLGGVYMKATSRIKEKLGYNVGSLILIPLTTYGIYRYNIKK